MTMLALALFALVAVMAAGYLVSRRKLRAVRAPSGHDAALSGQRAELERLTKQLPVTVRRVQAQNDRLYRQLAMMGTPAPGEGGDDEPT